MHALTRKLVALATNISFSACMVMTPWAQAMADDTCSSESSNCLTVNVGGQSVTYPALTLTPLATVTSNGSGGYSVSLAKGDQKVVDLNAAATNLGLSSSQIANMVSSLPSTSSFVFSRMSTLSGELDVTLFRATRHGNKTTLYTGKFTPQMGNRWAAAGTFATASERAGGLPGHNPFEPFEGGDQEFHNIPINSPAVAETITGMAARFVNSPFAILNMANFDEKQWTTTAHHFFTTTTTVHTAGYENPLWLVGLPPGMNSAGDVSPNYCLDTLSGTSCPTPEHQVVSGMAWSDWSAGNMPSAVTTIHEFQVSHTGFNFVTFILVVASVFSWGLTGVIAEFVHMNEQNHGDNVVQNLSNILTTNFATLGTVTQNPGLQVGAALGNLNYQSGADASSTGPFAHSNLPISSPETNPGGAYVPPGSDEVYFQTIEKGAMTAPAGQASTQNDTSGNNGYRAFSTFDQGYNNVAPSANVNLQFNSMQYIRDTQ
jgi:hypothetical protein